MKTSHPTFPFIPILTTVFILAKVFEVAPVASWSWWWVFSPVWIAVGVGLSSLLTIIIINASRRK